MKHRLAYKRQQNKWNKWKWMKIGGIVVASCFIILFGMAIYFALTLPSFAEIGSQQLSQSTRIYDRTGTVLLYETGAGEKRTLASPDEIPQTLKDATVSIEDSNFYNEPAFDIKGILRAAYVDVTTGSVAQGGSTITQQLARTAFLSLNQTFTRKLKELILAVKLGQYYTKDQILDLYLNEVSYGPNISGVETASEAYFGKPVSEIDLAQSALLAAMPQAPSYYSPWGSHLDELLNRQKLVLQRMYDFKKITKRQLAQALSEKLTFLPRSTGTIKAPQFVQEVEDQLVSKYGENMVENGGLSVVTTLDWNMQQEAEASVKAGAERNQELYGGYNAALVAEDPRTGQILAMVGSRDYFATSSLPAGCTPGVNCKFEPNFNVATQGLRQPGSSLKPFVYLTAFQMGYTPDTVLWDVPTEFSTNPVCPAIPDMSSSNKQCFHPEDFENFKGPMTMRDALAQSINVVAVKTLYLTGIQKSMQNAYNFGLTTLTDPQTYGLSLVLGGGAVHLIDLTKAYSVLAADGIEHAQSMILQVKDANGNVLQSYADSSSRVADEQSVSLVNDVLSDLQARSGLFSNINETTVPGYQVALKTGTSNDYRDTWAMGYTPDLVVGVWAGNNDDSPMVRNGSSLLAAVPMWHDFMLKALPSEPPDTFAAPEPTNPANPVLGGDYSPDGKPHSILFYIDKDNPTASTYPANPASDPQFNNWEAGITNWVASYGFTPPQQSGQTSAPSSQ